MACVAFAGQKKKGRGQMSMQICTILSLLVACISASAKGAQNAAIKDSTATPETILSRKYEMSFVFGLDGNVTPIVRSESVHTNLIERNRTVLSLCAGVYADERSTCMLKFAELFESAFTSLYLKQAADI